MGETHTSIWAPWRIGFLVGPKPPGCFLCEAATGPAHDEENFVLDRGEHAFVIMNRYPYTNGHLLIAPMAHQGDYVGLDDATALEIAQLTRRWIAVLGAAMKPDGFNVGWNFGLVAGAGVADHIHEHVVPRWNGDHNFMSVVSDMRLINQSLTESSALLRQVRSDTRG